MWALAFIGCVWFLFSAVTGKGKAFKSKMGTPLPEREAKVVRIMYFITAGLLLIVGIFNLTGI